MLDACTKFTAVFECYFYGFSFRIERLRWKHETNSTVVEKKQRFNLLEKRRWKTFSFSTFYIESGSAWAQYIFYRVEKQKKQIWSEHEAVPGREFCYFYIFFFCSFFYVLCSICADDQVHGNANATTAYIYMTLVLCLYVWYIICNSGKFYFR